MAHYVEGSRMGEVRFRLVRDSAIGGRMKSVYELACGNGAMPEWVESE